MGMIDMTSDFLIHGQPPPPAGPQHRNPKGSAQRAAARGTFSPTKPKLDVKLDAHGRPMLPEKVKDFMASMNRRDRRKFVADAKRSHRRDQKSIARDRQRVEALLMEPIHE